jgi:cyanophycinase
MTGPLVLVGGGEFTEGCDFDAEIVAAMGATEVAILATGWAYENPAKTVAQATDWFASLGVATREIPVYTRPDALRSENIDAIASAKFIYLTGVSPMHMRSVLAGTPFLDALKVAWSGGAALVGSGAGADVICDPMVDTRGGAFTVGLGLLSGVAVVARSDQWSPDKVRRTIDLASKDVFVVELPERTAIVLDDPVSGSWRRAGVGTPVVHLAGSISSIGSLPRPAV